MPRIFLVDQDPSLREWCRLHLGVAGFEVAAFGDGGRALEALHAELPDLVMVATNLAGSGAFALASAMREGARTAAVPLLFLVPVHDAAALAQARGLEPAGVLTKPFSRETLLEAVTDRLARPPAAAPAEAPDLRPEPGPAALPARGTASGPLLETKQASVLVVGVRNFVSLARSLSAAMLDRFLVEFASHARQAVFDAGGWIVRADAMSLVALFEDVPDHDHPHAARAVEAALGSVLASRAAKRWGETHLPHRQSVDVSVGCGIHTGEVIVARLTIGAHLAPSIAGPTVDLAQRLEGRARGLRWSIACSETTLRQCGTRFETGYRSSLTDSDHGTSIPIVEVRGFLPGTAKPGELAKMGEVREAMLANSLLASLAGDVDRDTADRTLMVRPTLAGGDAMPMLPGRRLERRVRQSSWSEAYVAVHLETGRRELVKVRRVSMEPAAFIEAYLDDYRRVQEIRHRNIVAVHEVSRAGDIAFVALEYLAGGSLAEAMQRQLSVGASLNSLAQACLALDALHEAGIVHGGLGPEHFHFRGDGALVLADFNTSRRITAAMGPPAEGLEPPAPAPGPREDFAALGRILHALLTGDRLLLSGDFADVDGARLELASRLPLPLSPIQACLDGLLGVAGQAPVDQAPEVLMVLKGLRDIYPLEGRAVPSSGGGNGGNLG